MQTYLTFDAVEEEGISIPGACTASEVAKGTQQDREGREAGRSREWARGLTAKDPSHNYQTAAIRQGSRRKTARGKHSMAAPGEEVSAQLTEALDRRNKGLPVIVDGKQTLARNLDWLAAIKGNVRQKTYQGYESYIRVHVQPAIGKHRMAKLNPLHLQRLYSQKLEQGLSPTTVRHIHATLHRALDQAVRWGILYRNVAELVDAPRRAQREMAALSPEQARELLDAAAGDRPRSPLYPRHQHRHEAGRDFGAPVERGRPGGRSLARAGHRATDKERYRLLGAQDGRGAVARLPSCPPLWPPCVPTRSSRQRRG